jgi:hypothetical protein
MAYSISALWYFIMWLFAYTLWDNFRKTFAFVHHSLFHMTSQLNMTTATHEYLIHNLKDDIYFVHIVSGH